MNWFLIHTFVFSVNYHRQINSYSHLYFKNSFVSLYPAYYLIIRLSCLQSSVIIFQIPNVVQLYLDPRDLLGASCMTNRVYLGIWWQHMPGRVESFFHISISDPILEFSKRKKKRRKLVGRRKFQREATVLSIKKCPPETRTSNKMPSRGKNEQSNALGT